MFAGFGLFVGLMTLLGVVGWLLRSVIHHQRWKRALKVQSDAHAKLLERCSWFSHGLVHHVTISLPRAARSGSRAVYGSPGRRSTW